MANSCALLQKHKAKPVWRWTRMKTLRLVHQQVFELSFFQPRPTKHHETAAARIHFNLDLDFLCSFWVVYSPSFIGLLSHFGHKFPPKSIDITLCLFDQSTGNAWVELRKIAELKTSQVAATVQLLALGALGTSWVLEGSLID